MKSINSTIDAQNTLQGQHIDLSVDQDSLNQLMQVLTNLYSDPVMAVLREYSCNAADSHIEAGNTRPIEVNTPSVFNPKLEIIDYGVGLSPDDITNIFALYGASTKRDTNDQTGNFGLGCKSALAYTSQFIMTAVKDGIETQLVMTRNEHGSGGIDIPHVCDTDKPNGVRVEIPANAKDDFEQKAQWLFSFWSKGSVLIDGNLPNKEIDGLWVNDNICFDLKGATERHIKPDRNAYVVMGGVPYPVGFWDESNTAFRSPRDHILFQGVVAWVEMGTVEPTPTREELIYNDHTIENLASLREEIAHGAENAVSQEIDKQDTYADALKASTQWDSYLWHLFGGYNQYSLKYRGEDIPHPKDTLLGEKVLDLRAPRGKQALDPTLNVSFGRAAMDNFFIVTNYAKDGFPSNDRHKLKGYLAKHELELTKAFITSEPNVSKWLKGFHHASWDEIVQDLKNDKPAKTNKKSYELGGSFERFNSQNRIELVSDINSSGPIVYFGPQERCNPINEPIRISERHAICTLFDDWEIVVLGKNRWNKFLRMYPHALHLSHALHEQAQSVLSAMSEADKYSLYPTDFVHLDTDYIDDPQFVNFINKRRQNTSNQSLVTKWRNYIQLCNRLKITPMPIDIYDPFHHYPLLRRIYCDDDHAYEYLNALYTYRQEGR